MSISVIIPTYNRASVLKRTLQGYADQSGDHQICEVLVVDDGSTDETESVVQHWSNSQAINVRYLKQENQGPGIARNYAIREANGEILLFGDDDVIPSGRMVAEHVAWHRAHPEANLGVLGLVTWAAEVNPTPFMAWSGLYGPQFRFGDFKPGMELDFREAYSCNISLKASFVVEHGGFNESIGFGYEDLEFCYQLAKHGFRLFYSPKPHGFHNKFETFEDTLRRIEKLYKAWPAFGETEAGRRFLALYREEGTRQVGWARTALKKAAAPLKALVLPLFRPLMDSRIPLPGWVYDQVFYHYVTPFSKFLGPRAGEQPICVD